jgi:hypothetical protein
VVDFSEAFGTGQKNMTLEVFILRKVEFAYSMARDALKIIR